jgi:hypothetical protein
LYVFQALAEEINDKALPAIRQDDPACVRFFS